MLEIKCLLSKRRTEWMGIAILMVVLYHLQCRLSFAPYTNVFKYWFFGVDLFIFFSGYGLCYSYEKNTILKFYKNRLFRILPLYFVQIILIQIINLSNSQIFSFVDFIGEITTLSFWGLGSGYINWYVAAILFLYLLFPIFYAIVKKYELVALVFAYLFSIVYLRLTDDIWEHDCLVARIPIYIWGIYYFFVKNNSKKIWGGLAVCLMFWNISFCYDISVFYISTCFCPMFIYLFYRYFDYICASSTIINNILRTIGKYSYEIYLADHFVGVFIMWYSTRFYTYSDAIYLIPIYVVVSVVFAYLSIRLNKGLVQLIR